MAVEVAVASSLPGDGLFLQQLDRPLPALLESGEPVREGKTVRTQLQKAYSTMKVALSRGELGGDLAPSRSQTIKPKRRPTNSSSMRGSSLNFSFLRTINQITSTPKTHNYERNRDPMGGHVCEQAIRGTSSAALPH